MGISRIRCVIGFSFALLVLIGRAGEAQELTYHWRSGAEYAYAFEVEATVGDYLQRVTGTSVYRASTAAASGDRSTASGSGTGFVVTSDGYLITCAHVIMGATRIQATLGEKSYTARVVEIDRPHDLAIVKIDAKDLPTLPLADSKEVQLAQEVRAVGFPLSDVLGSSIKVSRGTVSGMVDRPDGRLLQVDASINPGNSGGPLVNDKGEVVGIASAKLAGNEISNVGFAVPSNQARSLLELRKLGYETNGASNKLDGPTLARRVTPSVAMLTVRIGPGGIGSAERFALAHRGHFETTTRSLKDSRQGAKTSGRQPLSGGQVVLDTHGEVFDLSGIPQLPFCLGSQGRVGLDPLSPDGKKTWSTTSVTAIENIVAKGAVSAALQPIVGTLSIAFPAAERSEYTLGEAASDGTVAIKRQYELRTIHKPGERPLVKMTGDGTINFDPKAGMPRDMRFTGTLELDRRGRVLSIPITYKYKQIDPKTVGGSKVATGSRLPAGPTRVARPEDSPLERQAVPSKEARAKAQTLLDDLFAEKIRGAKTLAQKLALADEMYRFAKDEQNTVHRFVLLDNARRTAIDAGELDMAIRAANKLASMYEVGARRLEVSTLSAVGSKASSKPQNLAVARLAVALLEESVREEDFDSANQLGSLALKAARKAEDFDLIKRLTKWGRQLKSIREAYQNVQTAKAILEQQPDDADANLEVGKYYCFVRQDWETGIAMLALCSDPSLKAVAEQDLATPTSADKQAEVGDGWWQLSETADEKSQEGMQVRAAMWYRRAMPKLGGLAKLRIEKRLADAPDPPEQFAVDSRPTAEPTPGKPDRRRLSAASMRRELIELSAQQVQNDQTARSNEVGFTLGKTAFISVPQSGGLLVGLDISIGTFNKIVSVRPIFHTTKGVVPGPIIGAPTRRATRLLARSGYAIGALTVKGGIGIDGLGVTFMEIEQGGLSSEKFYKSNWFGSSAGGGKVLGGDGSPIVGIFGHHDGRKVMALGVVTGQRVQ